jgi:hypothetical protein
MAGVSAGTIWGKEVTVVFHKFATPEKVQTHLISYTLKDKLKHRCREYLERGFKRHSERSVKNIKSRHILTACFLGPWFQTFERQLIDVGVQEQGSLLLHESKDSDWYHRYELHLKLTCLNFECTHTATTLT